MATPKKVAAVAHKGAKALAPLVLPLGPEPDDPPDPEDEPPFVVVPVAAALELVSVKVSTVATAVTPPLVVKTVLKLSETPVGAMLPDVREATRTQLDDLGAG